MFKIDLLCNNNVLPRIENENYVLKTLNIFLIKDQ